MSRIQKHLRSTFLAGIFSAIPVAVTAFLIWYIDNKTRFITEALIGTAIPFLGIVIALAAIYLCGLVATTLLGKFFLGLIDRGLSRVPIFRQLYLAWKQISLTPGGTEGMFSRVVLISDEGGLTKLLGFCSGQPLENDPETVCVFVPAAPNPMNGRLHFVRRERCTFVEMSAEDAFKIILSTGNYIPPAVGTATQALPSISKAE